MKKVISFFVFVFILSARIWALDTYGTYQFTSLSFAATLDPSFIGYGSFSDFAYTSPLLPSGNSGGMGFRDWNDAAINENKYLSFTVTLAAPNNFNGISLKLNLPNRRASSEGPPNGEVRYRFGSTGNFLSFTGNTWTPPISTTTLTDYEFDLPINNSNQSVLEIRIYGWNGTTVGGANGRQWVFDNVKLSGSSLPLPIELTSFTANVFKKHVTLNWQTATETDNYGFEIERASTNNMWEKIGFVSGNGNSNSPKDYSFTDKTVPAGKYSYRLKQIDAIGNYSYSNEVEVDLGIPTIFALEQNYPNPFNPSTIISYQLPIQSVVQIDIFNSIGEKVAELVNKVKEAGYYEVDFNAVSLSSGIYFYSIKAGDFVNVKKMMMVK